MSTVTSMISSSANGEGAQTFVSSSTMMGRRTVEPRQMGGSNGSDWTWTVPVFSSTVLQFDV
jgi:hypothetical protein